MKKVIVLAPVLPLIFALVLGLSVVPGLSTALALGAAGPVGVGATGGGTLAGPTVAVGLSGPGPALAGIPPAMLRLYSSAAASCPGLPWAVLAAIGAVESDHGRSSLPGVHWGRNSAGAEGPMQFEPGTFAAFDEPVPAGGVDPPTPYDPTDAVYAASRMLCADGGADPAGLGAAIYDYNHSPSYVAEVLARAQAMGVGADTTAGAGRAGGRLAVEYALGQVGTPYRWGGESPAVGFDCSGLARAAWAAAGVVLPRVAQDQFDAGPFVPAGDAPAVGDLVFFGPAPGVVTHVGLVVDPRGVMVDAPHAGAAVRVEPFTPVVGAPWGSDVYLGATSPGG